MAGLKHFKDYEFDCGCGRCGLGVRDMDPTLLTMLDSAREKAGIPFEINSAIRCVFHNAVVGGTASSSHLTGQAVDIKCLISRHRFTMVKALVETGFIRVGVGHNFIHADIDQGKPGRLIWLY